jgi:hypothetical protein
MISVRGTDTICTIQKINHLLYRLERTDTKNQFSKIKKTSFCRRPDPRRGSGGGRRQLVLVVAEVGKEGVGGSRSSSWSSRWGRRASVGAPRGRGPRGGEGGHRWAPLVVVVAEVGKEGVGGCRSWLSSLSSGPKLRAAYRLHLAMPPPTASASPSPVTAMPPPTAQIVASPKPEKREKRENRMRGEKRERTQREDKKGEDPRVEIFFSLARAPVGFDFLAACRARALVSVV